MLPQKFDTTVAHKIINLMPELRGTDKRVAAVILEHFNRRTGQCDPGLTRIARLAGVSRRTVIRSVFHIVKTGVFRVVRHGGHSQRNSYEPVWTRFRELDAVWTVRFRAKSKCADSPKMSPGMSQPCHFSGDEPDTQTFCVNQSNETTGQSASVQDRPSVAPPDRKSHPIKETQTHEPQPAPFRISTGIRFLEAARVAAERRWNAELLQRYSATPNVYAAIIDAISPELQGAATQAEMHKRGAGIALILKQLQK
jgi:hypothetical protein